LESVAVSGREERRESAEVRVRRGKRKIVARILTIVSK
jgi:hypothetical protein